MPLVDAYASSKKNNVMKDTWGHLYPENGSSHKGVVILATGGSSMNTLDRHFPTLENSPMEFELSHNVWRHEKLKNLDWDLCAMYKVTCILNFSDDCEDMFLGEDIGNVEILGIECLTKYEF